jgi:hypothetical protein
MDKPTKTAKRRDRRESGRVCELSARRVHGLLLPRKK